VKKCTFRFSSSLRTLLLISFLLSALSRAQNTTQVNISSLVNADLITEYTNGADYPPKGGPLTVNGVPFTLATIPPNSDTAVIQGLTVGSEQSFSIPVNIRGVVTVYTLINSAFGSCGTAVGELDFLGATSTPYVYTLTEGDNIRDHNQDGFCNTATGIAGTARFGGGQVRLDMQEITLPSRFSQDSLTSITFKSYGLGYAGTPFLAGITISDMPGGCIATSGPITSQTFASVPGTQPSRRCIGVGESVLLSSNQRAIWTITSNSNNAILTGSSQTTLQYPYQACSRSESSQQVYGTQACMAAPYANDNIVVTAKFDDNSSASKTFTVLQPMGLIFQRLVAPPLQSPDHGFRASPKHPDTEYFAAMWGAVFVTPGYVSFANIGFAEEDIGFPGSLFRSPDIALKYNPPVLVPIAGTQAWLVTCDNEISSKFPGTDSSSRSPWVFTYGGDRFDDSTKVPFSEVKTQLSHSPGGDYVFTKGQIETLSPDGSILQETASPMAMLTVPWGSPPVERANLGFTKRQAYYNCRAYVRCQFAGQCDDGTQ